MRVILLIKFSSSEVNIKISLLFFSKQQKKKKKRIPTNDLYCYFSSRGVCSSYY